MAYEMNNSIRILSTMPLDKELTDAAATQGVAVDVVPFIQVSVVADKDIRLHVAALCHMHVVAVFTSANAVKAIGDIVFNADPAWSIYCMGHATKHAVLENFDNAVIKATAKDAAALAEAIAEEMEDEVVFFCGDKRLDTLPRVLEHNNVAVQELVVYSTEETPTEVSAVYDGMLFFSPSAVESFFSVNTLDAACVVFAIGNTTAGAVRQECDNKIVVSSIPSKERVVTEAVAYFKDNAA